MSETTTDVQQQEQQPQAEQQQAAAFNPFSESSWIENNQANPSQIDAQPSVPEQTNNQQQEDEEEIVDADAWLKNTRSEEHTSELQSH